MTAPPGYQVDTTGLGSQADTAEALCARVAKFPATMRQLQCPSEDLLGSQGGVAGAYGSFLNAWVEEFQLTAKALDELSVKIAASGEQYHELEEHHAGAFDHGER